MIDGRTGRCGRPVLFLEYLRIGDEKAAGDIFYRKLLLTFWYDKYILIFDSWLVKKVPQSL